MMETRELAELLQSVKTRWPLVYRHIMALIHALAEKPH